MSTQREFAVDIVRRLQKAGFDALFAGGCVRDELLGTDPKDYDVATNATPDQIRGLFGKRRTLAIGAAFGVITVLGRRPLVPVEVATFREDGNYSDGRHPDAVTFSNAQADAQRRDFTINGLFFDPLNERVIDYVGGQQDLWQHIVRAIGNPRERFEEDHLRLLRAARFAATLGFELETRTADAVRKMAGAINTVSAELIAAELSRMLLHARRDVALVLLEQLNLLPHVLPELGAVALSSGDAWRRVLRVAGRLQQPTLAVALAATLHASDVPKAARVVGKRLRLANKDIARADWLLQNVQQVPTAVQAPWSHVQPLIAHEGARELLQLAEAIYGTADAGLQFCRSQLALPREQLDPPPLLSGNDLIEAGFEPGPHFSEILGRIRDAQLEGEIAGYREALEFARQIE